MIFHRYFLEYDWEGGDPCSLCTNYASDRPLKYVIKLCCSVYVLLVMIAPIPKIRKLSLTVTCNSKTD